MRKRRLSWNKWRCLFELFVAGRWHTCGPVGLPAGQVEAGKSYFGDRRKGERDLRGVAGKVPVFWSFKACRQGFCGGDLTLVD